jgi:hypothetical protein
MWGEGYWKSMTGHAPPPRKTISCVYVGHIQRKLHAGRDGFCLLLSSRFYRDDLVCGKDSPFHHKTNQLICWRPELCSDISKGQRIKATYDILAWFPIPYKYSTTTVTTRKRPGHYEYTQNFSGSVRCIFIKYCSRNGQKVSIQVTYGKLDKIQWIFDIRNTDSLYA